MISEEAKKWLRYGERGLSSETIFEKMTGIPLVAHYWIDRHPSDPSDFRRCELLLRNVPEFRERFEIMKLVSPVWAALVEHWPEIVEQFEAECPGVFTGENAKWSAPKTYEAMKALGC